MWPFNHKQPMSCSVFCPSCQKSNTSICSQDLLPCFNDLFHQWPLIWKIKHASEFWSYCIHRVMFFENNKNKKDGAGQLCHENISRYMNVFMATFQPYVKAALKPHGKQCDYLKQLLGTTICTIMCPCAHLPSFPCYHVLFIFTLFLDFV